MPMLHADPAVTWSGALWRLGLIVGLLSALLLGQEPLFQRCRTLGLFRDRAYTPNMHGLQELKPIPRTLQCEDLHYYAPLHQIWGATQEGNAKEKHLQWFPPLLLFNHTAAQVQGTFVTIDAFTHHSTLLTLEDFDGVFMTHGFDLLPAAQDDPAADIYLFAVNHIPNQAHFHPPPGRSPDPNLAASRVELFVHAPGTTTVRHLRSIAHPAIRTPNDIFAISPTEFYVTNDHYSRHSHALRGFEDLYMGWGKLTSDVLHVSFPDVTRAAKKPLPQHGVAVAPALTGEHNPNGLGRGSSLFPEEVILNDAAGGVLSRLKREIDPSANDKTLKVVSRKQLDSTIDNPSFFEDPFPNTSGLGDGLSKDASGYIIAGLGRGIALSNDVANTTLPIPTLVWHVPLNAEGEMGQPKLIWQHDGYTQRSISSAILVAIPPEKNAGRKEGWLFTSGFVSDFVGVSRIDLSRLGDAPVEEGQMSQETERDEL